jgi:CelD/BcsL family acetyltransferase involved in cellulose biosynthesis
VITARRDGRAVALAPFFVDGGMIFFVGSGGSDYLDFIGDVSDPAVLDGLLGTARDLARDCVGMRLYHVPDRSRTGRLLADSARRFGWECFEEGSLPAPALTSEHDPAALPQAAVKQSLVRHERWFAREGKLEIEHASDPAAVLPHLDAFFEQHVARWAATPHPSLFHDPAQRRFYRLLTTAGAEAGWLRFTQVRWNGAPVAFHFGFCYRGSFLWYKPTYDVALARRSPGEVLLRNLLLQAAREGAHTFDFGLGDEAFKHRFATRINTVQTWGLYPPGASGKTPGAA